MLVHQHDHREPRQRAGGVGGFHIFGTIAAFGGDDRAFADEQIDDVDGLIELAAGVPAQIEDQAGHSFLEKIGERVVDIGEGGGRELSEAQIGDFGIVADVPVPASILVALIAFDGGEDDFLAAHGQVGFFAGFVTNVQTHIGVERGVGDFFDDLGAAQAFDRFAVHF